MRIPDKRWNVVWLTKPAGPPLFSSRSDAVNPAICEATANSEHSLWARRR